MPPPVVGPRARAKQPLAEAVGRTESWPHPLRSAKARIGPPDALNALFQSRAHQAPSDRAVQLAGLFGRGRGCALPGHPTESRPTPQGQVCLATFLVNDLPIARNRALMTDFPVNDRDPFTWRRPRAPAQGRNGRAPRVTPHYLLKWAFTFPSSLEHRRGLAHPNAICQETRWELGSLGSFAGESVRNLGVPRFLRSYGGKAAIAHCGSRRGRGECEMVARRAQLGPVLMGPDLRERG